MQDPATHTMRCRIQPRTPCTLTLTTTPGLHESGYVLDSSACNANKPIVRHDARTSHEHIAESTHPPSAASFEALWYLEELQLLTTHTVNIQSCIRTTVHYYGIIITYSCVVMVTHVRIARAVAVVCKSRVVTTIPLLPSDLLRHRGNLLLSG